MRLQCLVIEIKERLAWVAAVQVILGAAKSPLTARSSSLNLIVCSTRYVSRLNMKSRSSFVRSANLINASRGNLSH